MSCKKIESVIDQVCNFKEDNLIRDFVLEDNEKEEDIRKDGAFLVLKKRIFVSLYLTPENLIGSYLFYFLQPQKGGTTPLFGYDKNSIMWTIASHRKASYELIFDNAKVLHDYISYIPLLSLLGVPIKPENFGIVFDPVAKKYCSVQPLFESFFGEKLDIDEVYKDISQHFSGDISFHEERTNIKNILKQKSWLIKQVETVSRCKSLQKNDSFLQCVNFMKILYKEEKKMKLPIFTELSDSAKEYFRDLGEFVEKDLIPASLYQDLGTYGEENEQAPSKIKKKNIVAVKDQQLLQDTKPYALAALKYLGYIPSEDSLKVDVMLDGGTRPLRFRFQIKEQEYAVYLKLSEPTTILLRELYKKSGNLSVSYRSVTSPKFTIEEEIKGFHKFEIPKESQALQELDGYAKAVIAFDVCKFFAGIGDLEKAANSVISFTNEFRSVVCISAIDFNMSQIYNQGIRDIIKIHRTAELSISHEECDKLYQYHEKMLWERVQKQQALIESLIKSIKSMYELCELAEYIEGNYSHLEEKYEV